jgi:hypothetical protein
VIIHALSTLSALTIAYREIHRHWNGRAVIICSLDKIKLTLGVVVAMQ